MELRLPPLPPSSHTMMGAPSAWRANRANDSPSSDSSVWREDSVEERSDEPVEAIECSDMGEEEREPSGGRTPPLQWRWPTGAVVTDSGTGADASMLKSVTLTRAGSSSEGV